MNTLTELNPRVLSVSASNKNANYGSISKAAKKASEGDYIVVGPGIYSPHTTDETFPIYIPPGSKIIGSGANNCKINGESSKKIIDRPLDPYQSLVLLGDETSISGFTISNSGANAVSNEQGARILITENILKDNGLHGLLIFGTNGAIVHNNEFINNGTRKTVYVAPRKEIRGKQGHHIFVESRASCTNEVIITGNKLRTTYADAIDAEIFDQPEGVSAHIRIIGNIISDCGRYGLSFASSYGPSNSKMFVEIRRNQISGCKGNAIDATAALSIVNRKICNAKLSVNIIQNEIKHCCDCGINVFAAYDSSENSQLECNIIGNDIVDVKRYGICVIGGFGLGKWSVENSRLNTMIANNIFSKIGISSIFIQGGIAERGGQVKMVRNNSVYAHIVGNRVKSAREIIVNNGLPTNSVIIAGDSQKYTRKIDVISYSSP